MLHFEILRRVNALSLSVPRDMITPIAVFAKHKLYPDVFCIFQVHDTDVKLRAFA